MSRVEGGGGEGGGDAVLLTSILPAVNLWLNHPYPPSLHAVNLARTMEETGRDSRRGTQVVGWVCVERRYIGCCCIIHPAPMFLAFFFFFLTSSPTLLYCCLLSACARSPLLSSPLLRCALLCSAPLLSALCCSVLLCFAVLSALGAPCLRAGSNVGRRCSRRAGLCSRCALLCVVLCCAGPCSTALCAQRVRELTEETPFNSEVADDIASLWADPGVRETYERQSE